MQNKRIGISPQIRLLIEAIGDTIEDDYDITYPTHMKNNLWYHYMTPNNTDTNSTTTYGSVINALNANALYELWHHRLGHPGKIITEKFHTHTIGIPILHANSFYTCSSCLRSKFHN